MKGIVFTEFFELIEELHDYEMVDRVIQESKVESGGNYTAIGSYDFQELVKLLSTYSNISGNSIDTSLRLFGHKLLKAFNSGYGGFFEPYDSARDFLKTVDSTIHVEVYKLYPDAELPSIQVEEIDDHSFKLTYRSLRALGALAQGLIEATFELYEDPHSTEIESTSEKGDEIVFLCKRI